MRCDYVLYVVDAGTVYVFHRFWLLTRHAVLIDTNIAHFSNYVDHILEFSYIAMRTWIKMTDFYIRENDPVYN